MVQPFNIRALLFQNKLHQCKIWQSVQKKLQCCKFKYLSSPSHIFTNEDIPTTNFTNSKQYHPKKEKDEHISCFYTKNKQLPTQNKQTKKTPTKTLQLQLRHPKTPQVETISSPPSQPSSSFLYVAIKTNAYNLLNKCEAAGIQVTEHSENTSSIKSTLDNCKNKISLF